MLGLCSTPSTSAYTDPWVVFVCVSYLNVSAYVDMLHCATRLSVGGVWRVCVPERFRLRRHATMRARLSYLLRANLDHNVCIASVLCSSGERHHIRPFVRDLCLSEIRRVFTGRYFVVCLLLPLLRRRGCRCLCDEIPRADGAILTL